MPATLVSRRRFKLQRAPKSASPCVRDQGRDAATPPSLATSAYLAIRDKILRGQLRSGTALSRRRLAHELGMSVLPLTDALRRLEAEGLVETRARAGTRVRIPSAEDIREMYELREALESQAARLFAERATAAQRLELEHLADEVDRLFYELAGRTDDPAFRYEVHSTHVRFHLAIATYAASAMVKQAIERNHVLVLNWLFDVSARRTPLPIGFHADLARALVSGAPEVADTAIRAHVRYGLREITGNFNEIAASEWRERRRVEPARRARA
jgi:DNA-binding GntR family transcriptional regulator